MVSTIVGETGPSLDKSDFRKLGFYAIAFLKAFWPIEQVTKTKPREASASLPVPKACYA